MRLRRIGVKRTIDATADHAMRAEFGFIMNALIEQNRCLGQRVLALECACSEVMAEVALLNENPQDKLASMNANLGGVAMGVADRSAMKLESAEMTAAIEAVAMLSETALSATQACAQDSAWQKCWITRP
jgi:hypothetical protein